MTDLDCPLLAGGESLKDDQVELRRGPQDKFHPFSFEEAREQLAPQLEQTQNAIREIPADRRGARVIVELTLRPNYLASSWYPEDLLSQADLIVVGSRVGEAEYRTPTRVEERQPTRTLQLAASDDSLARASSFFESTATTVSAERVQDQLRRVAHVGLPGDERLVVDPGTHDGPVDWEAVIHPPLNHAGQLDTEEHARQLELWSRLVNTLGGEADAEYLRMAGGLSFMPITLEARAVQRALEFNPLRHLHPMPELVGIDPPTPEPELDSMGPPQDSARNDVPIVLFDLGVDDSHEYLNGYVANTDLTETPPEPDGLVHGTLSTSAALHGPLLPGVAPSAPPCPVHHFRIGPPPANAQRRAAYWALDQIEAVLRTGTYRVASLGMGINRPPSADYVNSWTSTLDEVAAETDVLIVVAAGNSGTQDPRPGDGSDRVRVPADGVNVLSVGAAIGDDSDWDRTSYSSRGPGRGGNRVQPMVMSFGGDDTLPFYGAGPANGIAKSTGTSFSAPSVARTMGELLSEIGAQDATVATLKAFAVHFAHEHLDAHDPDNHGFGLVRGSLLPSLECGEDAITVLYRDRLERAQAVAYPLPVPPRDLSGRWKVQWTISFLSPVDATSALDYTQAGLEVFFRPNAARISMNPPPGSTANPRPVDLRHSAQEYEALLAANWTPSGAPVSRPSDRVRTEQQLQDEGKWETIIRQSDSLLGKSLYQPRLWLNYLAREHGVLQPRQLAPELDVAMLITVQGPSGSGLYADVRAAPPFDVLTPLITEVPITV